MSAVHAQFIKPFIDQGGGTGGGSGTTCGGCYADSTVSGAPCAAPSAACDQSAACQKLLDCYDGCDSNECSLQCEATNAAGYDVLRKLDQCACVTACPNECKDAYYCA